VVDDEGRLLGSVAEEDVLALALPASAAEPRGLSYLPRCYGLRSLSDEELREVTVGQISRSEGFVTIEKDEPAALPITRNHQPRVFVVRDGRYVARLCRKDIIAELVNPSLGVACHP